MRYEVLRQKIAAKFPGQRLSIATWEEDGHVKRFEVFAQEPDYHTIFTGIIIDDKIQEWDGPVVSVPKK